MRIAKELIERMILAYSVGLPYHPGKWRVVEALLRLSGVEDLHRGRAHIVKRQGILWKLSPECRVQRSLYYHGAWASHELRELKSRLQPDSVFVDVGSYYGYYSIIAAYSSKDKARIYSFEPHSDNFALFLENLQLNRLSNVHPFKMALGSTEGQVVLEVLSTEDRVSGRILRGGRPTRPVEKVDMITLDSFVEMHTLSAIDLLKINAEGSELAVLQGGRHSIMRFRPTMFVELNSLFLRDCGTTPEELLRAISDLGYRPYRATSRGLKRFDDWKSTFDDLNVVCLPAPRRAIASSDSANSRFPSPLRTLNHG